MKKFLDLSSKKLKTTPEAVVDLRKIKKPLVEEKKPEEKGEKLVSKKAVPLGKKKEVIWWLMEEPPAVVFRPVITPLLCLGGLALGIYAIFQKNWLFLLLLILIFFTYFLLIFQKPPKRLFRLTDEGLSIDENFYPYKNLRSFSLTEKRGFLFLAFEVHQFAQKYLLVPYRKEKKEKIVNFLKNYLPEKEYQPTFLEALADFLGL